MTDTDRIEAVSQAFLAADWTTRYRRDLAAVAVAVLDAYDREHPTPATAYWKRVADRREEALDTLGRERNTWARLMADLRDERDAAKRDAEDARREKNDAQNERDDLDHRLADLRERIAAEIEAEFVGQDHHEPTFNSGRDAGLRLAARIARGGQS